MLFWSRYPICKRTCLHSKIVYAYSFVHSIASKLCSVPIKGFLYLHYCDYDYIFVYIQYVTEGLRGLVIDLSEQVSNSSIPQIVLDENLMSRDHSTKEINRRECQIVKKGIQRTEKHLKQLILNNLEMEPADISLIKKYKTVDVPCVHSEIGIFRNPCRGMWNSQRWIQNTVMQSMIYWMMRRTGV